MPWHYSEAKYDPSIRGDLPYIVVARESLDDGFICSEIRAHGKTPEEARVSAERGAAQIDSQARLFPWKVATK